MAILSLLAQIFLPVHGQETPPNTDRLKQSFNSLQQKYRQQSSSKNVLNDLDLDSAELMSQLRQCEEYNEAELNRLTQVREIDALEDSSIQSQTINEENLNRITQARMKLIAT